MKLYDRVDTISDKMHKRKLHERVPGARLLKFKSEDLIFSVACLKQATVKLILIEDLIFYDLSSISGTSGAAILFRGKIAGFHTGMFRGK